MTPTGIARVPGVRVGHWTDPEGLTGCSVVLCPPASIASGEVRGGAPGTRETDLLRPGTLVQEVNAFLLTGGSAFGLAAADGVMRFLEEQGIGFETRVRKVPIVPAAVVFDLGIGDPTARPGPSAGYEACRAASTEVAEGNVGAGTGATVAKLSGPDGAWKGGVGSGLREQGDLIVGALAVVNAMGEIIDESGNVLAAPRVEPRDQPPQDQLPGVNTTLVVVATNASASKERVHLLALAAHDGLDAAIRPAHTMWDGDAAFALATGAVEADQRELERLTVEAVAEAIRRGVLLAEPAGGFPAIRSS